MPKASGRPSRHAAAPPPIPREEGRWCWTCGRIISPRKSYSRPTSTPVKYCSDRCRREKPSSHSDSIEARIEDAFVQMLGTPPASDHVGNERKIVLCREIEAQLFGFAEQQARESVGAENELNEDANCSDEEESDGGVAVSVTETRKPKAEGSKELTPQQRGRERAANREKVRQAARRGVVFGFRITNAGSNTRSAGPEGVNGSMDGQSYRRVEAVQGGRVVEASFAKGDWGVRWTGQD